MWAPYHPGLCLLLLLYVPGAHSIIGHIVVVRCVLNSRTRKGIDSYVKKQLTLGLGIHWVQLLTEITRSLMLRTCSLCIFAIRSIFTVNIYSPGKFSENKNNMESKWQNVKQQPKPQSGAEMGCLINALIYLPHHSKLGSIANLRKKNNNNQLKWCRLSIPAYLDSHAQWFQSSSGTLPKRPFDLNSNTHMRTFKLKDLLGMYMCKARC